ncbi:MAG: DUF456 domain-containing protein [Bacteroidales bacterium]|nr:DUF456 domain-containing protein [Bacteroidales bacterium]
MDLLLISIAVILLLLGIVGCLVPMLPGPPLSFAALLLLQFTSHSPFTEEFLIMWGLITAAVTAVDYWVPIYGTKKLGGTKWGVWGAAIGLIIGLFVFPPFGIITGPLIGALLGELIAGQEFSRALRSALGTFVGFVAGTIMKLVVSLILSYHFIINLRT